MFPVKKNKHVHVNTSMLGQPKLVDSTTFRALYGRLLSSSALDNLNDEQNVYYTVKNRKLTSYLVLDVDQPSELVNVVSINAGPDAPPTAIVELLSLLVEWFQHYTVTVKPRQRLISNLLEKAGWIFDAKSKTYYVNPHPRSVSSKSSGTASTSSSMTLMSEGDLDTLPPPSHRSVVSVGGSSHASKDSAVVRASAAGFVTKVRAVDFNEKFQRLGKLKKLVSVCKGIISPNYVYKSLSDSNNWVLYTTMNGMGSVVYGFLVYSVHPTDDGTNEYHIHLLCSNSKQGKVLVNHLRGLARDGDTFTLEAVRSAVGFYVSLGFVTSERIIPMKMNI